MNGGTAIANNWGNKKRHPRGSHARHTLGVDVTWLKRLVTLKHSSNDGAVVESAQVVPSTESTPKANNVGGHHKNNGNHITAQPSCQPSLIAQNRSIPLFVNGIRTGSSLRKLRAMLRQNRDRSICNSAYEIPNEISSPPCSNFGRTRRSVPSLGISSLKASPMTMSKKPPSSTRVWDSMCSRMVPKSLAAESFWNLFYWYFSFFLLLFIKTITRYREYQPAWHL